MSIDKIELQSKIEKEAVKKNGGECESYEYCKFCTEPKEMFRTSLTPCADALLTLQDINRMLKNYIINKAKIATMNERIEIWEEALKNGENIFLNVPDTNLGMPKERRIYSSPVELEAIRNEMGKKQIEEMIKQEESRRNSLEYEVRRLDIAFSILNEKEKFIIECRYFENMRWNDIENSYNLKFNKTSTEKTLKNRIAGTKLKILNIIRKC